MIETDEGLYGEWEYSSDLFDMATVRRMTSHFETLLAGLVAHTEQRVATLSLLPDAERHQLLAVWNATQAAYPQEPCLHVGFAAQVARTPEAVAVVCADQQVTYEALNRYADQLAHYLQALGVGPEVRVGLCVERSLEMVLGLVGILKAGGVYVPLDPTYPAERVGFILAGAQVSVLPPEQQGVCGWAGVTAQVICLVYGWGAPAYAPP